MELEKLFKTQQKLDDRIVAEKGLEGVDLLDKKILALQVELGELANEWRGFKFWSEYQESRTQEEDYCIHCVGGYVYQYDYADNEVQLDCQSCQGGTIIVNPLLEEYVDCLHFILSIGNELGDVVFDLVDMEIYFEDMKEISITEQFVTTNWLIGCIFENKIHYEHALFNVLKLGENLGFTWNQIEQAYYEKNKINHERQDNGY